MCQLDQEGGPYLSPLVRKRLRSVSAFCRMCEVHFLVTSEAITEALRSQFMQEFEDSSL